MLMRDSEVYGLRPYQSRSAHRSGVAEPHPKASTLRSSPIKRAKSPDRVVSPDSGHSTDSSVSVTSSIKAVAMANALVGEVVMESPIAPKRRPTSPLSLIMDEQMSDMSDLLCLPGVENTPSLDVQSDEQKNSEEEDVEVEENDHTRSAGTVARQMADWVGRGVSWWENRQRQRQQERLERQVQEQRRRLYEAEVLEQHAKGGHTLMKNPTFRQMKNMEMLPEPVTRMDDENFKVSSPQLSKSGVGITVDLNIAKEQEEQEEDDWVPNVRIVPEPPSPHKFCPYIMDKSVLPHVASFVLPPTIAYAPWKRVYSLARDGDSFETFLRLVDKVSHTLLVVRTSRNQIFGGYADSPWEASHQGNPIFYGSAQACLFRIVPTDTKNPVRVYKWSGANRYIQFVDLSRKMLALGGGGSDGAFGLCVERDFQLGSTGSCATFNNEPLCEDENFEIVDVECYGFLTGQF